MSSRVIFSRREALRLGVLGLLAPFAARAMGQNGEKGAAKGVDPVPPPAIDVADNAEDAALRRVLAGDQRSTANRARDGARHPYETLRFFGLRETASVVEIAPGGGWYTEILAPYLREHGHLYAAHYGLPSPGAIAEDQEMRRNLAEKLAHRPELYDRVVVGDLPAPPGRALAPPGGADLVVTFRNLHNWIQDRRVDDALTAFFRVLKPGGMLGIEEHRAMAGTTEQQMIATGYVTEEYVVEHARAAGFQLDGRSEVNANPRDTKDYPNGVWSLPPTLRGGDTERARFVAIGESDRMTLRFIRP